MNLAQRFSRVQNYDTQNNQSHTKEEHMKNLSLSLVEIKPNLSHKNMYPFL